MTSTPCWVHMNSKKLECLFENWKNVLDIMWIVYCLIEKKTHHTCYIILIILLNFAIKILFRMISAKSLLELINALWWTWATFCRNHIKQNIVRYRNLILYEQIPVRRSAKTKYIHIKHRTTYFATIFFYLSHNEVWISWRIILNVILYSSPFLWRLLQKRFLINAWRHFKNFV